jgi:hypothetical protein
MKDRVKKLFSLLDPRPDAVVLANSIDPHLDQSFFYLFDVPSGLFEGSIAIAHPDGRLDVVSSILEAESARQAAKHDSSVTVHEMRTTPSARRSPGKSSRTRPRSASTTGNSRTTRSSRSRRRSRRPSGSTPPPPSGRPG